MNKEIGKMLPCPFCQNSDLTITKHDELFFIGCPNCRCTGPKWNSGEMAEYGWNTRSYKPESEDPP